MIKRLYVRLLKHVLYITGNERYSKLSFLTEMYDIKCKRGGSDAIMSDMLGLMQRAFYNTDAQLTRSFYEAKKTVTKMGLTYTKIDVCRYDCMLFWEDDASLEKCKRCNTDIHNSVTVNELSFLIYRKASVRIAVICKAHIKSVLMTVRR